MFRLPKGGSCHPRKEKDFNENISTYYILRQESAACSTVVGGYSTAQAMLTSNQIFDGQQTDMYCLNMWKLVQGNNYRFPIAKGGQVRRKAPLDGSLQAIVLEALRRAVLHNDLYPIAAGRPDTQQIYDSLRSYFYWPHMASNAYSWAKWSKSCRKHRPPQNSSGGCSYPYQESL